MRPLAPRLRKSLHRLLQSAAPLFHLDTAFLLILSASIGYSLVSLLVHVVDRSYDERLLTQISPDGKSLFQLHKTGMAIFDVQSGQVVDEVRLTGLWKNAFLRAGHREPLLTRSDWSFHGFRRSTSVALSSNAQIVVVRRFDDTLLWWNRQTKQHRIIPTRGAWWLDITLDEPHDRFYVESVRASNEPAGDGRSAVAVIPGLPTKFNAKSDLHLFKLSTGEETQVLKNHFIGQPVQGRPTLRVRAHEGALELLDWPDFPLGYFTIQKKYSLDPQNFEEVTSAAPAVIRLDQDDLIIENYFPPPSMQWGLTVIPENDVPMFKTIRLNSSGVSTSIKKLYSAQTKLEIFDNLEGFTATDYHQKNGQPLWRLELVSGNKQAVLTAPSQGVLQDLRADFGLSAAKLSDTRVRLARDDGVILEVDFHAPNKTAAWRIPLLPHDKMPLDAIAIFLSGAALWLAYATIRRYLFAKLGWIVLLTIATWPLILWSLERASVEETLAEVMGLAALGAAFILFTLCTIGLFFSVGRSRAIALAPWLILAMMAAGATDFVRNYEGTSFLDHLGIYLDWEQGR